LLFLLVYFSSFEHAKNLLIMAPTTLKTLHKVLFSHI
jgi:hypothetical protein